MKVVLWAVLCAMSSYHLDCHAERVPIKAMEYQVCFNSARPAATTWAEAVHPGTVVVSALCLPASPEEPSQ